MKQFQNFEEENIHYWTGRTDVAAMEAIARQTPLSEKQSRWAAATEVL